MNKHSTVFIGMDTHKENTLVGTCKDKRSDKPELFGTIKTRTVAITKMVRQLQSKYPNSTLIFVYEAGPCGYWLYRLLAKLGQQCYIVAPSLVPKKPGERVKTDKRDALKLTQLLKNGDLDGIYVPEAIDEAIRDLSRARERTMNDLNDARHQLKALFLRNNIHYASTADWSLKHMRWLTEIVLPFPSQQFVLQEMIQTISERVARLERLDNELLYQVKSWQFYPVVKAIQAMRGVRLLVAVGVISELGDLTRFDHPRKLMSYVGLTPSEHSSGETQKKGSITKCGNKRARRLLVQGANAYRYPAKISREMQKRQEGLSKQIVDIAWATQLRLCRRYSRLMLRGKHRNVVVTAIAREMIACIWEISREVILSPVQPRLKRVS